MSVKSVRARLAAATPGTWYVHDVHSIYNAICIDGSDGRCWRVVSQSGMGDADADLIAHAPADLTLALAVIEAVRASDAVGAIYSAHGEFCISSDNCSCHDEAERLEDAIDAFEAAP